MERHVQRLAAPMDFLMFGVFLACSGCSASPPITIPPGTTPIVTSASSDFVTAGNPFEAIVSNSGTVFVSVTADGTSGSATGVQVFASTNGNLQASCVNVLPPSLAAGSNNPVLSKSGCVQSGATSINGLLTVIDVAQAETAPTSGAILATIAAGCSPVRMSETADGKTLWVAVRGDDRVLAFDTAQLETNPDNALLGFAATGGTAPVGIRLFHNDQLLAVANSNRFHTGRANMTILNVASPAAANVVETVTTGSFPREVSVGADDATLYLTNFDSETLQVIKNTFH